MELMKEHGGCILSSLLVIGLMGLYLMNSCPDYKTLEDDFRVYLEQEACFTGCRIMNEVKETNLSYQNIIEDHNSCVEECKNHYAFQQEVKDHE